ncbi:MAG: hypothetical protein KEFWMYNX_001476 [Candidatus Fervidibacter sp.]
MAGSPTIAVVVEGDDQIARDADGVIVVPKVDELMPPIPGTVVGQLFGYYLGTDQLSHAKAWLTAFPLGTH